MIIIGVIMHHYTRGGRFHFIEGGESSSSSALASPQSSLSLAPLVGKSLPLDNHHYLDHHHSASHHLHRNFGSTSSASSSLSFRLKS